MNRTKTKKLWAEINKKLGHAPTRREWRHYKKGGYLPIELPAIAPITAPSPKVWERPEEVRSFEQPKKKSWWRRLLKIFGL